MPDQCRIKITLIVSGCIAIAVVGVIGVGFLLPVKHKALREAKLSSPVETVWQIITDFAGAPSWRADVKTIETVIDGGETLWREKSSHGDAILYRTLETVPPTKLVRQIANKDLPFGGQWTLEVIEDGSGCVLRITEDGEVYNPLYRFMSRFVFGHTATLDNYLKSLQAKLGKTA